MISSLEQQHNSVLVPKSVHHSAPNYLHVLFFFLHVLFDHIFGSLTCKFPFLIHFCVNLLLIRYICLKMILYALFYLIKVSFS